MKLVDDKSSTFTIFHQDQSNKASPPWIDIYPDAMPYMDIIIVGLLVVMKDHKLSEKLEAFNSGLEFANALVSLAGS